jgi:hypothetical protein
MDDVIRLEKFYFHSKQTVGTIVSKEKTIDTTHFHNQQGQVKSTTITIYFHYVISYQVGGDMYQI